MNVPSDTTQQSVTVPAARQVRLVAFTSLVGTTIEWYDFFLYGTMSGLVFNRLYFPSHDTFVSTALAYTVYAVGFVTRPVGGIVFGHFGDTIGRKPLLVLTLLIMGVSTFLIGLIPTYEQIGVAAPMLLLLLRLMQGIGLGGEWGGAVIMAFEYAPRDRRGFYASFPQVGLAIGLSLSTAVVALLTYVFPEDEFLSWGWRIAFLVSIVLVAVGLFIRLKVLETPEFERARQMQRIARIPVQDIIREYRLNVLLGWGARYIDGVVFNVYAVFVIAYLTGTLDYDETGVLLAISVAALVLVFTLPLAARFSDIVGRRRVYSLAALTCGLAAFPTFAMMLGGSPWLASLAIVLMLGVLYAPVYGPEAALFCELFDTEVRYSGISIVYQVSGIVSSSITPLVATILLESGGGTPWWVASYVCAAGIISAVSAALMRRTF
jgi:MFS family permease